MTEQGNAERVPRDGGATPVPVGRLVLGTILIIVGFGALAESADWFDMPWEALLPSLLILVGLAMTITARRGWNRGLFVLGLVLSILLAVGTTVRVSIGGGIGDRFIQPLTIQELAGEYELGVGSLDMDLSKLILPSGVTKVRISVGVGDVAVALPAGGEVFVDARTSIGEVVLPNGVQEGVDARLTYESPGYATATAALSLDIRVSLGSIEVRS